MKNFSDGSNELLKAFACRFFLNIINLIEGKENEEEYYYYTYIYNYFIC